MNRYLDIKQSSLSDIDTFNRYTRLNVTYNNGKFSIVSSDGSKQFSFNSIQEFDNYRENLYLVSGDETMYVITRTLEQKYFNVRLKKMSVPINDKLVESNVYLADTTDTYWILDENLRSIINSKYPYMRYLDPDLMAVSNGKNWNLFVPSKSTYDVHKFTECELESTHRFSIIIRDNEKLYLWSKKSNILLSDSFSSIESVWNHDGEFYIVSKDNKYGILDSSLKYIQYCQYDSIENLGSFYRFSNNGMFGIMNGKGIIVLDEEYSSVEIYLKHSWAYTYGTDSDSFKVCKDNKFGIWNYGFLVPCNYDSIKLLEGLNERYHLVEEAGKYGLMHYSNQYKPEKPEKKIFDAIYDDIKVCSLPGYSHEKEFLVKQNELYGIVNSEEETIVPIQYNSLIRVVCDDHTETYYEQHEDWDGDVRYENHSFDVHHVLYQMYDNGKMFFSESKKDSRKCDLERVSYFCYIASLDNKYGVIDSNNEILIPFEYDEIEINSILNLSESAWPEEYSVRCFVLNSNGWGIRDEKQIIFPCSKANIVQQNHYYVFKGNDTNKYGTISYEGTQLTDAIFDGVDYRGPFIGESMGALNDKGELIIPCEYDYVRTLNESNIRIVKKNDKIGAWCNNPFSKTWEHYIQCMYDDILIQDSEGNRLKGLKTEDELIYTNPCIVQQQGKVGLYALKKEGTVELIPLIYDRISRLTYGNGMCGYEVTIDNNVGYYNSRCTEKLECKYDQLDIYDGGKIIISKDDKYGLSIINKGVLINVLDCIYDEVDSWHKTFRLGDKYGRWDFVDKKPMITAEAVYDQIDNYVLKLDNKYGFWGFNNGVPSVVLPCEYDSINVINSQVEDYYQDEEGWQTGMRDTGIPEIIIIEKNSKKGVWKHIDHVWKQVLETEYDDLSSYGTISKNGKMGLMQEWNVVIPCEYDRIESIREEIGGYDRTWITHYMVSKEGKWGLFFNKKNNSYGKDDIQLAIPCNCDEIISRKGTFKYKIGNLWGCYSSNFNIEPAYDDIRVEDKYIITKSGNLSSFWEISNQGCSKMYDGFLHMFRSYLRYDNYLINTDSGLKTDYFDSVSYIVAKRDYGSYTSDIQYKYSIEDDLNSYYDHIVAIITNKEGKLGLYDKDLNKTLQNGYERIVLVNDHERELIVFNGKHYGIYNDGLVIDCIYDAIMSESLGYDVKYRVTLNGKIGLINKDYQYVIEPLYDDLNYEYINNYTRVIKVSNENRYGLLLTDGKTILAVEFDSITYNGPFIHVVKDKKQGLYFFVADSAAIPVVDVEYDDITISGTFAIVTKNEKSGIYRLNIESDKLCDSVLVMDIAFDKISINESDIIVTNKDKCGLYRICQTASVADMLLHVKYDSIFKIQNYYIVGQDGKYGLFCTNSHSKSQALMPCLDVVYDKVEIHGSKIIATLNNKKGWFAKDGSAYLECVYDEIHFIISHKQTYNQKEVIIGQIGSRYKIVGILERGVYSAYNNFMASYLKNIETEMMDKSLYFDNFEIRDDSVFWCCRDGVWGKLITNNSIYIETIVISENNKYGLKINFVDVLDPLYDNISVLDNNTFPTYASTTCYKMCVNNQEGRVLINGKAFITDLYDSIKPVKEQLGLWEIKTGDNVGVINQHGVLILPCQYASYEIDSSLVIYKDHIGKTGIVSLDGNHIISVLCDRIQCISRIQHLNSRNLDVTYKVERNGKYGLVSNGKITLPIIYDAIDESDKGFHNCVIIKLNGKFGLYNKRLEKVSVECIYDKIDILTNGVKVQASGLYGIVSLETGSVIVSCEYQEIKNLCDYNHEQRYLVYNGNQWGVFNDGKLIIPNIYEDINIVSQDDHIVAGYYPLGEMYIARINGLYGLVDSSNNTLIPFEYQSINLVEESKYPYSELVRYFIVQSHFLLGVYDSKFNKICECQYHNIKFNEDWWAPMLLANVNNREYRYKIDILKKEDNL